jgi:hypothetical protein
MWEGGSVSGVDTNVYLYAVPPPYATGYGSLAEREFYPGSTAEAQFASVGTGVGQYGCLVIASTEPPEATSPQGEISGATSKTITDTPFQQSGGNASSSGTRWAFIGAIDWNGTAAMQQRYSISDNIVRLVERVPQTDIINTGASAHATTFQIDLRVGTSTDALPGSNTDLAVEGLAPDHATEFEVSVYMEHGTTAGDYEFHISSENVVGNTTTDHRWDLREASAGTNINVRHAQVGQYNTGNVIDVFYQNVNWTAIRVSTHAYIDSVLASR